MKCLVCNSGKYETEAGIHLCPICDAQVIATVLLEDHARIPRQAPEPADENEIGLRRLFWEVDEIVRRTEGETGTRNLIDEWAIEGRTILCVCRDQYAATRLNNHPHRNLIEAAVWAVFGINRIEIAILHEGDVHRTYAADATT